jgi:hypothetical protein
MMKKQKAMTPQAAVKKHEQRMHPGKAPSFKKGGKTDADMLSMGRGLAKVNNQQTGMRKP